MNNFRTSIRFLAMMPFALAVSLDASATELVYTPINPSFGGNPNNASALLSIAAAQNTYKAPALSALERFNASLQQAILNRLSTQSLATIFGANSTLVPGTYDTSAYTIQITDSGNGTLTIATTDKKTGAVVSFEVSTAELSVGP
jgi:curli production assembly/transport component CsgF